MNVTCPICYKSGFTSISINTHAEYCFQKSIRNKQHQDATAAAAASQNIAPNDTSHTLKKKKTQHHPPSSLSSAAAAAQKSALSLPKRKTPQKTRQQHVPSLPSAPCDPQSSGGGSGTGAGTSTSPREGTDATPPPSIYAQMSFEV